MLFWITLSKPFQASFIFILVVFLIPYGIVTTALLYPNELVSLFLLYEPNWLINLCVRLSILIVLFVVLFLYFRDSVNVWKVSFSSQCWHCMVKCSYLNTPFMIWTMNWTVPRLKTSLKYKRPTQTIQEPMITSLAPCQWKI